MGDPIRGVLRTIAYWVRLALLTLFGPATLDDEHDPVVQLNREHWRDHQSARHR